MHKEAGERRDFLPPLIAFLDRAGAEAIVLEDGYGSGMGLTADAYLRASPKVRFGDYDECLSQDVVVVLRCPAEDALRKVRRGARVLSMFHYPTRPGRVQLLRELGVRGVSLDSLTDERGSRLVQNLEAVGWNGVRSGMRALAAQYRRFEDPGRRPIRVKILGAGAVGGHAARAATRYGDPKWRSELVARGVPGVEVTVVDFDCTFRENDVLDLLERTDLLVDATARPDPSRYILPNPWLGALPPHAVIVDLAVDPYDFTRDPPAVKGIEGVPEGNLDQYLYRPDDPVYERMDPRIDTTNRRTALSCYSWPGVYPRECMEVYGAQLEPVLQVVLESPDLDALDPIRGRPFERVVARADVMRWMPAH